MKTRFNSFDIRCIVIELQRYVGLRVNQVYDIDNKTYLIRLQKTEEKIVLLIESGNRIHATDYEWPKNPAPSGFSMKLRKHLKNKRLESVSQLGVDRIVDLQFGSGEASYHVFLELFDRGNMILTDFELTIQYVLRPHTQGDRYKFAVREKYPTERARLKGDPLNAEIVRQILESATEGENLKKILMPRLEYGPALLEHVLIGVQIAPSAKIGKEILPDRDVDRLITALDEAEKIFNNIDESRKAVIVQKVEKRPLPDGGTEDFFVNTEFHPILFRQHNEAPRLEFETLNKAVDAFFSSVESQKIDLKMVQQEKDAMKKLDNVRKDHTQRLQQLEKSKESDKIKAELITKNCDLVDKAVLGIHTALANQIPWPEIKNMVKASAAQKDPVACCIKDLKLDINHITLQLTDPFSDNSSESENEGETRVREKKPVLVDIDLDLSAFANARRYYDQKRSATKKQQKTLESQHKALKSAEKKTKKSLQEMKSIVNISKARKVFWFEKFFWFISSENYLGIIKYVKYYERKTGLHLQSDSKVLVTLILTNTSDFSAIGSMKESLNNHVIGGRDSVQNELVVKRYMRAGDVYVHADIHGASSVVIKNPSKEPIPPKTLNEAGTMAICYSVAWEAKVLTTAWWVYHDQVLKSAPSGEYLPTGSFSIKGKKNFLPPSNFILGFGFLFKLEESFVSRHADERRVKSLEDELSSASVSECEPDDIQIDVSEGEDDDEDKNEDNDKLETLLEENNSDEDIGSEDNVNFEKEEVKEHNQSDTEDSDENDETHLEADNSENSIGQNARFPDTEIKFHHLGKEMSLQAKPSDLKNTRFEEEELVVYLGDDKPVVLKNNERKENKNKEKNKAQRKDDGKKPSPPPFEAEKSKEEPRLKRGQKSKLKKIKEKYKDQDEEDRRLRMEFLLAAGSKKKNSKKEKKKEAAKQAELQKNRPKFAPQPRVKDKGSGDETDEETAEAAVAADVALLASLTGIPYPDDEILFAVPVVAPYQTLQNYKFKVKVMPGTGKRGKSARTALSIFLRDKLATQREKTILKGVKDEELARNFPGKVKISAPQLHK